MFDDLKEVARAAGVWCPASARLAEAAGARVVMLAGSIVAASYRGLPDRILMTATDLADVVRRVRAATALPILVDADHGYGGLENTALCVRDLCHAGATAVTIEDTDLPPKRGGKSDLVSLAEGAARMQAAVWAAKREGGLVVGRTSAAVMADEGEMLRRLLTYGRAGCDALMPVGTISRESLRELSRGAGIPIVLSARPDGIDDAELHSLGVRVVLTGHQPFLSAMSAAYDAYLQITDAGTVRGDVMAIVTAPYFTAD